MPKHIFAEHEHNWQQAYTLTNDGFIEESGKRICVRCGAYNKIPESPDPESEAWDD